MRRLKTISLVALLFWGLAVMLGPQTAIATDAAQSLNQLLHFAETNVGKLNVRLHASQDSEALARIEEEGTPLIILDKSFASDNTLWYHAVTWGAPYGGNTDGIILGWIRSDFVTLMGMDEFMNDYQYWTPPKPTSRPTTNPTRTPIQAAPPIYVFPTPVPAEPPLYTFPPRTPR